MNISTQENKEINISDFLKLDDYVKQHQDEISNVNELFYIYKITNTENNKIYIGKTKDIHRRATEYISEYNSKNGKKRSIWFAIMKHGMKKFIMEPIDIADGKEIAAKKEIYYISITHSYDPDVGYNQVIQSVDAVDHLKNYKPRIQQAEEKMRRSKLIAAINPLTKEIIFSTGLKLFGDYINRGKDEIKSAAKRSSSLNGFYIYYLNNESFSKQIQYAEIYSKKEKVYVDYDTFFHLADMIVKVLIHNVNTENYSIKFIHQSDDSESGYVFNDPEIVINYYKSLIDENKINPIKYSLHNS